MECLTEIEKIQSALKQFGQKILKDFLFSLGIVGIACGAGGVVFILAIIAKVAISILD
jgi:hypothetical protein